MADIKSPADRSRNMSAIKNRDTGPEKFVRRCLYAEGYRYRIAPSSIPGHPDLYLAKYNLAIFVHGCFWHRHEGCKYAYSPGSRTEFWQKKFSANVKRDIDVHNELKNLGIRCLIIWECAIRKANNKSLNQNELIGKIKGIIHSDVQYAEVEWNEGFKTRGNGADRS